MQLGSEHSKILCDLLLWVSNWCPSFCLVHFAISDKEVFEVGEFWVSVKHFVATCLLIFNQDLSTDAQVHQWVVDITCLLDSVTSCLGPQILLWTGQI